MRRVGLLLAKLHATAKPGWSSWATGAGWAQWRTITRLFRKLKLPSVEALERNLSSGELLPVAVGGGDSMHGKGKQNLKFLIKKLLYNITFRSWREIPKDREMGNAPSSLSLMTSMLLLLLAEHRPANVSKHRRPKWWVDVPFGVEAPSGGCAAVAFAVNAIDDDETDCTFSGNINPPSLSWLHQLPPVRKFRRTDHSPNHGFFFRLGWINKNEKRCFIWKKRKCNNSYNH